VIASAAFGIEVNSFKDPNNDFQKIATKASDFSNWKTSMKFAGYIFAPLLMKMLKIKLFDQEIESFFQEAVLEMMNHREKTGVIRHDMINLLIQARKGKLSNNNNEHKEEKINEGFATVEESQVGKSDVKTVWNDEDLAAQAFIFFFAGFDTVATTMGFLAYELMANPDVQDRLYEEIHEMEEELDGKLISYDQIQGLKLLDQCVSETLRKWPAAPVSILLRFQLKYVIF
jgi:cytochrome P450 family 9